MSIALIDTIPKDARSTGSVNLGYEIALERLGATAARWFDVLPERYDTYAFNIFYPTHIFNMLAFLNRNGISSMREARSGARVIVGGQGVSNLNGCLDSIVDEIYLGELDGDALEKGWNRLTRLTSSPVVKGGNAMIELTRGCKYRCKFCEYGWVQGGKYREKDLGAVKHDITELVMTKGVRNINFLSANLGAYSQLDELMDFCDGLGVKIVNTDICLRDFGKARAHFESRKTVKVGLESFDEATRARMNKPIKDADLLDFLTWAISTISHVHLYLIYGLPGMITRSGSAG